MELVARADLKRVLEFRNVDHDPIGAVFAGRMRVGSESVEEIFFPVQPPPDLRPAHEQSLIRTQAIDDRRLSVAQ